MGRRVAAILKISGIPFVIVEKQSTLIEEIRESGMLVLEGEATQEEVLRQAGLTRAKGLLTAIGDDVENLYIGMTAKMIRPNLPIVCRVLSDKAVSHLKRAGINQVISPEEMGAGRMVQQLLRPEVVDFLDLMLTPGTTGAGLEAYQIPDGCKLAGQKLKDSGIRERFGLFVIALRRAGAYIPNPGSDVVIQDDDVLILVGTEAAFVKFRDELAPVC
ncbi:MAG: TrkA family potassium uptake protein [Candidatus Eisenbacteria bacterium]|nr:TrkA family potassium uptake protein [Candidatus Eisenbacteria bacterium]